MSCRESRRPLHTTMDKRPWSLRTRHHLRTRGPPALRGLTGLPPTGRRGALSGVGDGRAGISDGS